MHHASTFIVSAPAGTGKTTLITKLLAACPDLAESISYTTRLPRKGEIPGKDYHFVSLKDFQQMVEREAFLEHVTLYGHHYGTARDTVEKLADEGKKVVLVIDTQGGLSLKNAGYPATYIFLLPPSMEALRDRLSGRSTETSSIIEERLACAEREMREGKGYDYQIVNDDLEIAYQELKRIIFSEDINK